MITAEQALKLNDSIGIIMGDIDFDTLSDDNLSRIGIGGWISGGNPYQDALLNAQAAIEKLLMQWRRLN